MTETTDLTVYAVRATYDETENAWLVAAGSSPDGTENGWTPREFFGPGYDGYDSRRKADDAARRLAEEQGYAYVTPYDPIVAG
jgi:hypothetical protein